MSIQRLKLIKKIQMHVYYGLDYTPDAVTYLFESVSTKQPNYVYVAALLAFMQGEEAVLDYLLDRFELLNQQALYLVIPMLVCTQYVRCYSFCIDRLGAISDEEEVTILVYSLASAEYEILPLIIEKLITDSRVYLARLKRLLKKMGFAKVQAYLMLSPSIPFEAIFREVFGDSKIDEIKHKI